MIIRFFLLFTFFTFFSCKAFAQIGIGPEAGVGMSSLRFAPDLIYTFASVTPIVSGRAGGILDVPIQKHLYFQTGTFVSAKGAERTFAYYVDSSSNESVRQRLHFWYLEMPINFLFKSGSQGTGRCFFGMGATLSYLIGGKNVLHDNYINKDTLSIINNSYKIKAGEPVKGFDVGINLFAGYELRNGLFFRAYYTAGVNDIGLGTEIDKNRMWGVSCGYILRKTLKETDPLTDDVGIK